MNRVEYERRGDQRDRALLTRLIRELPLGSVLNITATMLAERQDLDGMKMQEFQRKINDLTWPLVTTDHADDLHKRSMNNERQD